LDLHIAAQFYVRRDESVIGFCFHRCWGLMRKRSREECAMPAWKSRSSFQPALHLP
jgi:hypothetical protein